MKFVCSLAFQDPTHSMEVARAADACGWDSICVSDHVVHPQRIESPYPYTPDGAPRWEAPAPWPDPWVAISAMAAVSERIRFMTGVYVLPLRNPFAVAKAVGTVALMSGGRVTLGIGAGWMREEFDLLEQDFRRRGKRMDEMLDVMRKLWAGGMVEHHGEFYDFEPLQMSPAVSVPIPIYSGGLSEPALRRVGRKTDGWVSDLHTIEELASIVRQIRGYRKEYGRADAPLDIVGACKDAVDIDGYRRAGDAGVTHIQTMPWVLYGLSGESVADKLLGIERFANDVITKMR